MSRPFLEIKGVRKAFNGRVVLDGIDLDVERGSITTIMGKSGIVSGLYLDPVQYLNDWEYRTAATGANVVNQSPGAMHNYDSLTDAAIDPYVALRDAFASRRASSFANRRPRQRIRLNPPSAPSPELTSVWSARPGRWRRRPDRRAICSRGQIARAGCGR